MPEFRSPLSHRPFRRAVLVAAVAGVVLLFAGAAQSDLYLRIHRGIDVFGKVYKEIALQHVDALDPERLMRSGIDGMLKGLDPYTVFLDEQETDEIDLVTTGRYGGIGVSIGVRDGEIVIVNLLEGFSAAKQGLQVGDRIVAVEGTLLAGMPMEAIRKLVRGAPGTEVHLRIAREGEPALLEFVLVREDIPVRNITYAEMLGPGIGYVRLERFSRTAADDFRTALKDLQRKGPLTGLVLDVRDNPGGLLDIAVDVLAKVLPESSFVVSTRGRTSATERRYVTTERPVAPDLRLVVLVNENSASASEIVAGAVQDLDRGVVLGTRTFGKGLVQTISRLTETASLKITTARYYTPSGRCIQELDYAVRKGNGDATSTPDSLRQAFRTAGGRLVFEAGGITPDTVVRPPAFGALVASLHRRAMFFKYANHLAAEGRLAAAKDVPAATLDAFERYLTAIRFSYDESSDRLVRDLREQATLNKYGPGVQDGIGKLESMLAAEKREAARKHAEEIRNGLREEIVGRLDGEKARIAFALTTDPQVHAAVGLLKSPDLYRKMLSAY